MIMKFTKLFSTLVLTTIMVFAFVITGSCASATYQVSPSEGSTVKPGDSIGVIQTLPGNLGFKEASISLIDGETGTIIRTNTNNITDKRYIAHTRCCDSLVCNFDYYISNYYY